MKYTIEDFKKWAKSQNPNNTEIEKRSEHDAGAGFAAMERTQFAKDFANWAKEEGKEREKFKKQKKS